MERKQEQDTTDDRQKQGNPADETVIYKIGGTFYEVSTSCGGSEPLFEKMKRLIKSENLKAPTCYPAFYLVLNHTAFNQIKKRHSINYSDGFYIGLLYAVPLVLS